MPDNKAHIIIVDGASGTDRKTFCFELALILLYNQQKTALLLSADSPLRQTLNIRKTEFPQLPLPAVLTREEFAQKSNEYNAVIIPTAATDELAAMAETYITLLPKDKKVASRFKQNVMYINGLWELKKKIAATHGRSLDWVVCENNLKEKYCSEPSAELFQAEKMYGFRLCPPLNRRNAYQANARGLSAQDKSFAPLKESLTYDDICAKREIIKLAEFIFSS